MLAPAIGIAIGGRTEIAGSNAADRYLSHFTARFVACKDHASRFDRRQGLDPYADGLSGRVRAVDSRAIQESIRRSQSMPTWSTEVIEPTKATAKLHLLSVNSAPGTTAVGGRSEVGE